jgi:hypothetical protein
MNACSASIVDDLMMKRMRRALREGGDTHTLGDIIAEIDAGNMQSFVVGNSWAVTCILDTPRRRVLEIFMAVGVWADMPELHRQVTEFAKEHGVTLIRAFGRRGWLKTGKAHGWAANQYVFTKEI